jgi:hypothetical protein
VLTVIETILKNPLAQRLCAAVGEELSGSSVKKTAIRTLSLHPLTENKKAACNLSQAAFQ